MDNHNIEPVVVTNNNSDLNQDEEETCVLSQGRMCICSSCDMERHRLLKKRKLSETDTTLTDPSLVNKMARMTSACRTILECIGEDPDREGLLKTPERWAKALLYMTSGYSSSPAHVLNEAIFTEDAHKEIVVVKNIDVHSMCEHHMVPFTGTVSVGYIPNGKIIGLSKIARIAEVFSRRLQVQERLTGQIADAIDEAIQPLGVAVVIECSHFCMVMRGVQKVGAKTVTSCVRGIFRTNQKTRKEFFDIINGGSR
ncbi:hypothetical protein ACHAW6_014893 [Cyclotella cf. meneghiniana]